MTKTAKQAPIQAFSFGDAESVLNRRDLLDYCECWQNGRWFEPPIAPRALARILNVTSHHRSAIEVKLNLLIKTFIPSPLLSRATFRNWMLDYLVMANGYIERIDNVFGRPIRLDRSLALNTRRGVDAGSYFFVDYNYRANGGKEPVHEFEPGSVFQLMETDVSQEIYGLPGYLSAQQSMFLNEAATLFRRRYYINGAHAGFIFYLSEPSMNNDDVDAIRESLKSAKGVGNFKNLFINAPAGKKDGVQIIPISEVAARDEFLGIKNTSAQDIMVAHRVPPQILGIVPTAAGGFGDVDKASVVFFRNEIEPLQMRCLELNDWMGVEVVAFGPYDEAKALETAPAA